MDNNFIFDDILKEKAKNEELKIPESLNSKIKDTLNSLPEKRSRKFKLINKGAIAAAIILSCLIGTFVAKPSFALNIPVVNSVFGFLSENNIIYKDYVTYSSDLNMSKTCNGATVTINSIVYDDIDLNIGYTIKSENKLKEMPVIMNEAAMKINGKTIGFGGGETGKFIDDNTYVGITTIDMAKDYLPKEHRNFILGGNVDIPDNFIMDFNINKLSENIRGNWDFKFKVSNEKIKANVKSIKPNKNLSSLWPALKVNEILITPINTALRTSSSEDDFSKVNYLVFDDKERPLENKGASGSGSADTNTYYSQILFRNIYNDSKTLTFIPYKDLEDTKNIANDQNNSVEETSLKLDGITTLKQGYLGDYKVTKIEFLADKTLVHYECSKYLSALSGSSICITDSYGKDYYLQPNITEEVDASAHKYIARLPVLDKNAQYKLKASDYKKMYDIREDLQFTINIK